MAREYQWPTVETHEIASGSDLDGSAPDGTDSGDTLFRGRYRKYEACTEGGLFEVAPLAGATIREIQWNLPGLTNLDVFVQDDDGVDYLMHNSTDVSGFYIFTSAGKQIPPTFKLKAVGTTAAGLTGDGRFVAIFGQGWGQQGMARTAGLGSEDIPPGKPAPV